MHAMACSYIYVIKNLRAKKLISVINANISARYCGRANEIRQKKTKKTPKQQKNNVLVHKITM